MAHEGNAAPLESPALGASLTALVNRCGDRRRPRASRLSRNRAADWGHVQRRGIPGDVRRAWRRPLSRRCGSARQRSVRVVGLGRIDRQRDARNSLAGPSPVELRTDGRRRTCHRTDQGSGDRRLIEVEADPQRLACRWTPEPHRTFSPGRSTTGSSTRRSSRILMMSAGGSSTQRT